jgi:hypothetical protein
MRAVNNAGTSGTSSSAQSTNIDTVDPVCSSSGGSSLWTTTDVGRTISASCTEATSGILRYEYVVDASSAAPSSSTTGTSLGATNSVTYKTATATSYIHMRAVDNAGNIGAWTTGQLLKITAYGIDNYYSSLALHYDSIATHSGTTWTDQSANARNGRICNGGTATSCTAGATWATGVTYTPLSLDGVDDYVYTGWKMTNLNYTYEVVVRPTRLNYSETQYLICNYESDTFGSTLGQSTSNNFYLYSKVVLSDNSGSYFAKSHPTVVNSSTTYSVQGRFRDSTTDTGVRARTSSTTDATDIIDGSWYNAWLPLTPNQSGVAPLAIGGNPSANGYVYSDGGMFKGYIYSVRIYTGYMSDDWLQKHYAIDQARFGV